MPTAYTIEVADSAGGPWREVASSRDRRPFTGKAPEPRYAAQTSEDRQELARLLAERKALTDKIARLAATHEAIVTVEENVVAGGAGSGVGEALAALGIERRVLPIGLPDEFVEHGTRADNLAMAGLDQGGIERAIARTWPAHKPALALASAR